jgi:hypothetical protein
VDGLADGGSGGKEFASVTRNNATHTDEIYKIILRTQVWHQAIGQTHVVGPKRIYSGEAHARHVRP